MPAEPVPDAMFLPRPERFLSPSENLQGNTET
jgi:hypothetical protein